MGNAIFKELMENIWYRRVGKGRYHVMELIEWAEHMSESEMEDIGANYNLGLSEVDLLAVPLGEVASALDSCGNVEGLYQLTDRIRKIRWEVSEAIRNEEEEKASDLAERLGPELRELITQRDKLVRDALKDNELEVMYSIHSYGLKAPLHDENGNNIRELKKTARNISAECDDPDTHEAMMDRPVNKIGSTAREFMQGDLNAALLRNTDRTDIRIMRKMHGLPEKCEQEIPAKRSITASVNLQGIPSDDPLAYMMGYMRALGGDGLDEPRDELAEAYIEGYRFGVDVKKGDAAKPEWHVQ